jgi:hypothetical protein
VQTAPGSPEDIHSTERFVLLRPQFTCSYSPPFLLFQPVPEFLYYRCRGRFRAPGEPATTMIYRPLRLHHFRRERFIGCEGRNRQEREKAGFS